MVTNIAGVVVVEQIEEWRKRSLTNARDDLGNLSIPDGSALFACFVGAAGAPAWMSGVIQARLRISPSRRKACGGA
jgi:hypothetical protein